ncbi:MAG TPA: metallophosphoesterase [Flavobacteriaceae bacterium]|nr:metallophosphoesterase [Flavobacteriaceae bacterium]
MRWIIFIIVYLLIDIYAFQAIRTLTRSNWGVFGYFFVSLLVLGNFLYHWLQPTEGNVLTGPRSYAFGFLLTFLIAKILVVVFMFGEDIVRFFVATYQKLFVSNGSFHFPSRRKFVSTLALGIAAIPFFSMLYGMYRGKYNFKVMKHRLVFDDLPEAFEGYRIIHISDIHSGSFDNPKEIEEAVNLINQQKTDAVMFTGDLVNNTADEMRDWKKVFSSIKAPDGVFSVFGNHDYGDYYDWPSEKAKEQNLEMLKNVHREMGWDLLLNEYRTIEKNGQKIMVVGVENWGSGGFIKKGDIDLASEGLKKEDFKILLSHDPSYWAERIKTDEKNYQLTLSGHTHGMQFGVEIPGWFKWSPIQYRYEYWAGIYKEFGRYINVNRGFGYLGYPGRVGIWPEISVIELQKGKNT